MKQIDISILVPVFNEQDSISELYGELLNGLPANSAYEIIFINDGSSDNSINEINNIFKKDNNVKLINFFINGGKSEALNLGFRKALGDIIITIDGDLQDDPSEIKNLIDKIRSGSDMVTGWKKDRKDSLSKRIQSKIFNFILRLLTGIQIHDFNCGLKAYKRHVIKSINIYGGLHRFIPVLVGKKGFIVDEIIVNHRSRKFGVSKYGKSRIFHGFFDLITVLFLNKYFNNPLHLFGFAGFIMLLLGFGINAKLTYDWFFNDIWINPSKNPLFFLGILLMIVGIQLFSTGLIGELMVYLNRKKDYIPDNVEFHNFK
jgi:glycosyltransferase involved in cell wall biosynthesis